MSTDFISHRYFNFNKFEIGVIIPQSHTKTFSLPVFPVLVSRITIHPVAPARILVITDSFLLSHPILLAYLKIPFIPFISYFLQMLILSEQYIHNSKAISTEFMMKMSHFPSCSSLDSGPFSRVQRQLFFTYLMLASSDAVFLNQG